MADPNPVLDRILAALKGAHDVLDIRRGDGALAGALIQHSFTVTGVDLQSGSIAKARIQHPNIQFIAAVAETLPFPPMSYDAAVF